jgi:hypothetical protein
MASLFPGYVVQGHDFTRVQEYTPSQVAGETFIYGDFTIWDDSNNWAERAGANPTAILGISEVSSEAARVLTPNGRVPIRLLFPGVVIALSSTTTPSIDTHVQNEFGITRASGGQWQLDTSKTGGNARMLVVRVDVDAGIYFCEPLQEFISSVIDT